MTRRLPWKTSDKPQVASPHRVPKIENTNTPSKPRSPSVRTTPLVRRREHADLIRTPSTSPPPEPPQERLMLPGPLQDDRFRMVEDEFLETAQRFTTHLHRAEYSRLKTLAKSQNAATIREIQRPVVGSLTNASRRHQEAARRNAKQRKVLRDGAGDSPRRATSLQGLLESPSKHAAALSSHAVGARKTRAAAGFRSSQASLSDQGRASQDPPKRRAPSSAQNSGSATGDDVEILPPPRSSANTVTPTRQTVSSVRSNTSHSGPASTPKSPIRSFPISAGKLPHDSRVDQPRQPFKRRAQEDEVQVGDDDDPFGINKRKMRREKSREQFRKPEERRPPKKAAPDTMPSFL